MTKLMSLSALESAVGSHLGYGEWLPIRQSRIDAFADATGDHQWIHVDPARAAAGVFGTTVAHGYLTLALIPALVEGVFSVEGVRAAINYGCNRVRFPAALPVDGSVRAGVELLAVEPTEAGAMLTTRVVIDCDRTEKPVCVAECLALLVA